MENDLKTNSSDSAEYLAFQVGGQSCAVDISAVREIRGWAEPSGMPNTDPLVMGVLNLRGEVLPLLDLAAKFGLQTPEINERCVIFIVEAQGAVVGLLVDSVSDIIASSEADMKPPPEVAKSSEDCFVTALALIDEKLTRILGLSAVLPAADPVSVAAG